MITNLNISTFTNEYNSLEYLQNNVTYKVTMQSYPNAEAYSRYKLLINGSDGSLAEYLINTIITNLIKITETDIAILTSGYSGEELFWIKLCNGNIISKENVILPSGSAIDLFRSPPLEEIRDSNNIFELFIDDNKLFFKRYVRIFLQTGEDELIISKKHNKLYKKLSGLALTQAIDDYWKFYYPSEGGAMTYEEFIKDSHLWELKEHSITKIGDFPNV